MSPIVTDPVLSPELPWYTEGLFSAHDLTHRLPDPKSAIWPDESEADAVTTNSGRACRHISRALSRAASLGRSRTRDPILAYHTADRAGNMDAWARG